MILDFPYIKAPPLVGDITTDAVRLLNENGKESTAIHCVEVAKTCAKLAGRFHLDQKTAYMSGILHDISAVIKPADMLGYAENSGWRIDPSEREHHFILHQRISALIAEDYFGVSDESIITPIQYHSTLRANASDYDMLLFLSDKLSWDQQGIPPFLDIIQGALERSLKAASLAYINFVLEHDMILLPHQWLLEARSWLESATQN